MSNTLKGALVLIALMVAAGAYVLKQNESRFQAELSPHQDLSTLMTTGKVELKTFRAWCESQGHAGEELNACVQRRESKAKQLLELEQAMQAETPSTIKLTDQEKEDTPAAENKPTSGTQ